MYKRLSPLKKTIIKLAILISIFPAIDGFAQKKTLWKFATGSAIYSSPVISKELIYFGSADHHLYALDKVSGKLKWKFLTKGQVHSSAAIHEDIVVFSSADGNVYALNKNNGKQLWKYETGGEKIYDVWDYYLSSPVIHQNMVYVGSGDSVIYAIDVRSGEKSWSYKTGGIVHATPVVKDNKVLVGSYDGFFYALDAQNGKLIWKFKTVGDAYFPKGEIQKAALVTNSTVFFGSRDFNIYALDLKTGTGKWNMKERGSWIIATPLLYQDNIYFGTSDTHQFYCMSEKSGKIKWTLPLNMRVYGTALIMDNQLVFGCFNGKIYFVDPESGRVKDTFQTQESKDKYSILFDNQDKFRNDVYDQDYLAGEKKILA
jgi:outer membrane protein assembly factor BamB